MRVELAASAGFCFGVSRAVDLVWDALEKNGPPVYTVGRLIHNPPYLRRLAQKGILAAESVVDIPDGAVAVFRAHGVTREDELLAEKKGLRAIDATCPYVKAVHDIVRRESEAGAAVLILGDRDHPEVRGIASRCAGETSIFADDEGFGEFCREGGIDPEKRYILVSQTTMKKKEWEKCCLRAENSYTNIRIFDTICSVTEIRQGEAARLAARCDACVVVGGADSSNTRKLFEICKAHCERTYFIEDPDQARALALVGDITVGVTAGASTPADIIKEVVENMSEVNDGLDEMSFAEALEMNFKTLNTGDKVKGIVTGITPSEIHVDLGTKHAGYIPVNEMTDDPTVDAAQLVKPGDEIEVVVMKVNDAEGTVMLSKKRAEASKNWELFESAVDEGQIFTGTVTDVVKGGVIIFSSGIRVFIPASQTGIPREGDMNVLKGTQTKFKIIEVNRGRKRAVGSIRAVSRDLRKQNEAAFWETAEVGRKYEGVVKSLTSYGAFVDIGGVDGMVHVSELSWTHIKNPAEVLKVGDKINVYIKALDPEKKRISLGYKTEETNPWNVFQQEYKIGERVTVKIAKLMPFGAFATIIPGVDGLIHISQMADRRIAQPSEVVRSGDTVDVRIIDINYETHKISLSMTAVGEDGIDAEAPAEAPAETTETAETAEETPEK